MAKIRSRIRRINDWSPAFIALAFTLGLPPPAHADYPVVLVHGFCSDASTWNTVWELLPRRRFGDELVRYYVSADGAVQPRQPVRTTTPRTFAIDFYDRVNRSFDARRVADVSTVDKVGELKAVIDRVKAVTGSAKVILIGHSMGGVIARSYVQGWGLSPAGRAITFGDDVAAVITIDTPHSGSWWANIPLDVTPFSTCLVDATINKAELSPESTFLTTINTRPWPDETVLDVLVGYHVSGPFQDSDGAVTRASQDVRNVSPYWSRHRSITAHLQSYSPGGSLLHNDVLQTFAAATSSRLQTIIDGVDRRSVGQPPPLNLSGSWSGQWSSSDGGGDIAIRLTQSGTSVTGSIDLLGSTSPVPGTFSATVTLASPVAAQMSWTIRYRLPGTACEGSFGGSATATITSISGRYSGSDCTHAFSNGMLTLTFAPPPATPLSTSRRFVASATALYLSELSPSGRDDYIGTFRARNGAAASITDIAVAPDGMAYALSFSTLYALDTSTGTVTPLSRKALRDVNAIVSDANGLLWTSSLDGSIYRVSAVDGSATLVRQLGSGWRSSGDLAFDASGLLWATVNRSGDTSDTLLVLDLANGNTVVKATNLPPALFGLTFANGMLFAMSASDNAVYRIDLTDGMPSFVRRLAFSPVGATRRPQ